MPTTRGLLTRIPVPRAAGPAAPEQEPKPASGELLPPAAAPPRAPQPPEPDFSSSFDAQQHLFSSDGALSALSVEQRIRVIEGLTRELGFQSTEDGTAMRAQLSSVFKTLTAPDEFERVYFSVNTPAVLRYMTDGRKVRARMMNQMRSSTPGDWAAYSKYLDAVTQTRATTGNRIELLSEGTEVMQRLTAEVTAAKRSIDISMYKWEPDSVGLGFAAALIAKANPTDPAQAKVAVRVMIDRQGSFDQDPNASQRMVDELRRNGVEVIVKETGLLREHLDHRKIIVIDDTIGFTGGMNIGELYRDVWRDQLSRIEGPLVHQLRASLHERWRQEGGTVAPIEEWDAKSPKPGAPESRVITHQGRFEDSYIKAAYLKALYTARRQINISTPYFTDPDIRRALCDAAKRGVTVRLMMPAVNDVELLRDAARASYPELIKAGVEVYEYQSRMAHQKIATIDGTWSTFGSSNLDARSLEYNEELNVFSTDAQVATDLNEKMFDVDLKKSVRITSYQANLKEKFIKAFSGLL